MVGGEVGVPEPHQDTVILSCRGPSFSSQRGIVEAAIGIGECGECYGNDAIMKFLDLDIVNQRRDDTCDVGTANKSAFFLRHESKIYAFSTWPIVPIQICVVLPSVCLSHRICVLLNQIGFLLSLSLVKRLVTPVASSTTLISFVSECNAREYVDIVYRA